MMDLKKALNLTFLKGRGISQTDAAPLIAQVGFDGCFWSAEEGADLRSAAQTVRAAGLTLDFIHAPVDHVDKLWVEGEEGRRRLEILIGWVRQCAENQVPVMVSHVWTQFAPVEPNQLGLDRFGALLELAQREGVKIAFENAEVDKFLLYIRENLFSHPAAGFCFDSGHELCYNGGRDQLALFGSKLLCTHLNDNLGQTGPKIDCRDDAHLLPFDGQVDWTDVTRRLKKAPPLDTLTFELKMQNQPGRHTHDRYDCLSPARLLELAFERAVKFDALFV